ncbi:MAG: glutamate 5-kinase [Paracoccaceae bacterium]|jgi:glutamate 5-kinase
MASLTSSKRVVIKIGSALLVDAGSGRLNRPWLLGLAQDVAMLRGQGKDVLLVSSGSIALGRGVLGFDRGDLPLEQSQAAASVGQIQLAQAYSDVLAHEGVTAGQVLLTLDDSQDRRRYLNSRATLETLLSLGVVPIINENDTVATDEIRFGDNDRLAAQVAVTVGADCLILLSDIDGLYTDNPNVNLSAQHIEHVDKITSDIEIMAGDPISGLSKGGMKTKIMAAKTATQAGCAMAITLGAVERPISAMLGGARKTWFAPITDPQTARKAWISAMKRQGEVHIDHGAAQALTRGTSLLPAGVTHVSGVFERGDAIAIVDATGRELARGLVRYSSEEAQKIMGQQSKQIATILGYERRAALVHRDDMAVGGEIDE